MDRPFLVTASNDEEPALGEGGASRQQSELQPGEIRRPGVHPPTPVMDWGRGDSLMWDAQFGDTGPDQNGSPTSRGLDLISGGGQIHSPTTAEEPTSSGTPLTGYGRGDNLWGRSPTTADPPGDKGEEKLFPATSSSNVGGGGGGLSNSQGVGLHSAPPPASNTRTTFPEPIHDAPYANQDGQYGDQNPMGYRQESAISLRQDSSLGGMRQDTSLLAFQFRTQSQILSDELYFQSMWFPPPPPPRVPKESRRTRSELWYYYASKWDITHTQPPPPRCPLALMEEEHAQGLAPQSKVPYRGEYWLDRCNHWFRMVQDSFHPPERHSPMIIDPRFVLDRCINN